MTTDSAAAPVSVEAYYQVQRFLVREAGLLDRHDYPAWLALLAEDIHYRVTARVVREAGAGERDYDIIDETRSGLTSRVEQISSPRLTRAENPPSFTRRLVTNIDAVASERSGEIVASSSILVYRGRPDLPRGGFYIGERSDVLRSVDGEWRLARRLVRLDQNILFDGALSVLL